MPFFNGASFKGILRYAVYGIIGGWMFFLGILVGRGTSPVTFDTKKFHDRLEAIVQNYEKREDLEEKIDLQFYDVLNKPALQEGTDKINTEILPKKETGLQEPQVPIIEKIPVKTSLKTNTLNKAALDKVQSSEKGKPPLRDNKSMAETRVKPEKSMPAVQGAYTIQVAAFKSAADAVTQMARLEKKGFTAYQTLGKKGGVTWYRVRVGSFETRAEAAQYIEKLNRAKVEAMIVKKEE
jgi:cell division protein FtsN